MKRLLHLVNFRFIPSIRVKVSALKGTLELFAHGYFDVMSTIWFFA